MMRIPGRRERLVQRMREVQDKFGRDQEAHIKERRGKQPQPLRAPLLASRSQKLN